MHFVQTQALILSLAIVCAVAAADMLAASTLQSLMSKPDVSIQVLPLGSVFSSVEGNTTTDDFVTEAQVISSGNKEDNEVALNTHPEYCPDDYENTPLCKDCGGFTLLYFKELNYYDARCKGVSFSSCKDEDSQIH
jgi:hypothetical protein